MHPDAKERSRTYKVTEIVANQLVENLTILLGSPDENEKEEQIEFHSLDQIKNIIQNKNKENTSTNQVWKFQQPLSVIWHQPDRNQNWFIGFFLVEKHVMGRSWLHQMQTGREHYSRLKMR